MGVCDYSCFFHSEEGEQCLELHEDCEGEHVDNECGSSYAYLVIFDSEGEKVPSKLVKRIEKVDYDWDSYNFNGYKNDAYYEVMTNGSGLEYPHSFWKYGEECILNLCPTCYGVLQGKLKVDCFLYKQSVERKHGLAMEAAINKYKYLVSLQSN